MKFHICWPFVGFMLAAIGLCFFAGWVMSAVFNYAEKRWGPKGVLVAFWLLTLLVVLGTATVVHCP